MIAMPSFELLLLIARAVFLVFAFILAAVTFTAWRRATQLQSERMSTQADTLLQHLTALEARFEATRRSIAQLAERLERPTQFSGALAPGYQIAIRLAKNGASCAELMRSGGLSQREAELVQRLHGAAAGATAQ